MSSSYCIQIRSFFPWLAMTTLKPVNFTSLQFSLNVQCIVVFLFSKYPFNYGSEGGFCINLDAFGFAEVGQNFNIDLTNYQGYYMLILIAINHTPLATYVNCSPVGLYMTFQNTTISPITSETIISNFGNQERGGFCQCYDGQSHTITPPCISPQTIPAISLDDLDNQLIALTQTTFIYENNTTIEFAVQNLTGNAGTAVTAPIVILGNQEVIDFLSNNNIEYSILPSNLCQSTYKLFPCTLPCKSIYQITKLLIPPKKYSLISSKLWNEIVQDLYLAYSVFKYINYLSQFPYLQNIYHTITEFYDFYENFKPYVFTPLIHAKKGLPLTADYFNSLIDAIIELANFANIQLQKRLSYVQPDEIVKALQFDYVVDNVNQLLTFNFNQYFLLDCSGNRFNNLLNSISTFLNVLINNVETNITIPNNVYIKNFLIYNNLKTINIYGTIANFIMNSNQGSIQSYDYSIINSFIIQTNLGQIYINNYSSIDKFLIDLSGQYIAINNNAFINTLKIITNYYAIDVNNNVFINILEVINNFYEIAINDNAYINTLKVENNYYAIIINNNAYINTLEVVNNYENIIINDNVTIENFICYQNVGNIFISPTATIKNFQCS